MDVIRIVLLCVAGALIAMSLRQQKPEMAALVALAAGVMALLMSLGYLGDIVAAFSALSQSAGISDGSVSLMLRACGVSLIAEFACGLCKDAGEGVLAQRIEFGARAALLAMGVPLLTQLVERIIAWMP